MKNISNVELRCNDNVDKPVSKETSISEGDSVPVDTGVSTPPSLGSFSQPSGSVSSKAPAEVVASPEPPGPRKISKRKNRAARFSPMEGLAAIRQHTRTPLWPLLAPDLLTVLNFSFREGHFPISLRSGIITLLFKKGDRLNPANWRPITLLNVDYKICARVLAARLLKVIHDVVGPDQTSGVPGRFIGENVTLMRDLAHYCEVTNFPAAILSLDQEKAFDRVDWSFLFKTEKWVLGILLLSGFVCCTQIPVALSWLILMVTSHRFSLHLEG